jgi:anaerobic magnesium-protoporphyrin IX monomethyl ester cyclase
MPLGLLALGSWLEGRHVVIVDGRFELAPEARVVELARSALLLGVSVRTGEPLREALRVSRAARAASPQLPVVWGGPHVLLDPESCLATGVVDACVPGAGEEALQAAVAALRSGRPLAWAPGLHLAGGGEAVEPATPPTRLWPRADYSLLDVERYFEERGARRLDYCSSRGRRDAPDWLGLRPERVVGEVIELAERHRLGALTFVDEDFFADAARVEAIASGLVDAGASLSWRAEARPEDVLEAGPAALQRLRESGCRGLQVLAARVARERLLETAALLRAAGVGGRFVFEVGEADGSGALAAAVSAARALCAMDSRFRTPIRQRRVPEGHAQPGRSLESWATLEKVPWKDPGAERRLSRVAFYFAEAQRTPGRRLGKHLLRVLSLLRVRLGFFALDLDRVAVELAALVRTGRPRPAPGD